MRFFVDKYNITESTLQDVACTRANASMFAIIYRTGAATVYYVRKVILQLQDVINIWLDKDHIYTYYGNGSVQVCTVMMGLYIEEHRYDSCVPKRFITVGQIKVNAQRQLSDNTIVYSTAMSTTYFMYRTEDELLLLKFRKHYP